MLKPRVLLLESNETTRKTLENRLNFHGHFIVPAADATQAQAEVSAADPRKSPIGVVLVSLPFQGKDTSAFLKRCLESSPAPRVIALCKDLNPAQWMELSTLGALECFPSTIHEESLSRAVGIAERSFAADLREREHVAALEARAARAEAALESRHGYRSKAASMQAVNEKLNLIRRDSLRGDAEERAVLLTGARGSEFRGIARSIHQGSRRAKGPWITLRCSDHDEAQLDADLFGAERGSATRLGLIELAAGGTLYLENIESLGVRLQAKLMRALIEKKFTRAGGASDQACDIRAVFSSFADLPALAKTGAFREDFLRHLEANTVRIPALSDRKDEVITLATEIARRTFRAMNKDFTGFSDSAQQGLLNYKWPGNYEELLSAIERAALVAQNRETVGDSALFLAAVAPQSGVTVPGGNVVRGPFGGSGPRLPSFDVVGATPEPFPQVKKRWMTAFEKDYLTAVLRRHFGNVSSAAREAKIDRSNFLRIMRKHGLSAEAFRRAKPAGGTLGSKDKLAA